MRLDHVALTVADRGRSAAFYGEHFAFALRHEDDHLLLLADEHGGLLALSSGPPPADLPRTSHFGVRAGSADEVRVGRRHFAERGVTETEWQDDGVFVRVQVLDPDGHRVDLYVS